MLNSKDPDLLELRASAVYHRECLRSYYYHYYCCYYYDYYYYYCCYYYY